MAPLEGVLTLSEIGRALNRHAGSVHGVLAATGGALSLVPAYVLTVLYD
jgi:hypothetical protein